jgi:glycosyltransferase involved in cell wall biosynthesis
MDEGAKQTIAIIIPSFNDLRIVRSIYSVTKRDPENLTRLYIIDGGSRTEVTNLIRAHLRPHDYLRSEKDAGIFDALNKGLDAVQEEIIGWLGSDDCFASAIDFSAIASAFESEDIDCYLFDLIFTDGARSIRRSRVSRPTPLGFRLGLHPLHFSSFWRTSRVGKTRFDLAFPISGDQDFYCKMTWPVPRRQRSAMRLSRSRTRAGILQKTRSEF